MDPEEFRTAGHHLIDRIAKYLGEVESLPLFPDVSPEALDRMFDERLPSDGEPIEAVFAELEEKLLPYCAHVSHPGYMGLITPTPTPVGILGDLLASALNQNLGAYTIGPSAVAMERRTVRWLTDLIGFDARAGGNLTSGGMTANFLGLKLARDGATGDRAQHEGLRARHAVYFSEERHVSVDKAVDCVGLGREARRPLPTDDEMRVRLDALEDAIANDKKDGVKPLCIVAMAGTTNTGAVDDLVALRRIADREGMWIHADAAYGGGMLLSGRHAGILRGLELADSVTIDPHKWFFAPLDAGALLVKDAARLTASFGFKPPYLTDEKDVDDQRYQYFVHGFEQSRRFRSLKVWMSFKRYGAKQIGAWIDANVDAVDHLDRLVRASDDFESLVRPKMSAICIRYRAPRLGEPARARLHAEASRRIEQGGRFWFSTTRIKDKAWFRICPVNFRTRREHMDELLATLRKECAEIERAGDRR